MRGGRRKKIKKDRNDSVRHIKSTEEGASLGTERSLDELQQNMLKVFFLRNIYIYLKKFIKMKSN